MFNINGNEYLGIAMGYPRVSTNNQGNGVSLDAQEEAIRLFCANENLYLLGVVKEIWSGTKIARDKFEYGRFNVSKTQYLGSGLFTKTEPDY